MKRLSSLRRSIGQSRFERRIKAIRQRIDRLDNAFLYEQSIDIDTYDRHKERLAGELTLARMDRRATELEEMDEESIPGFAERVLPRGSAQATGYRRLVAAYLRLACQP